MVSPVDTDLAYISRSPMAEAVLKHQISEHPTIKGRFDIRVDSAGTGAYHAGDEADDRTIATCKKVSLLVAHRSVIWWRQASTGSVR